MSLHDNYGLNEFFSLIFDIPIQRTIHIFCFRVDRRVKGDSERFTPPNPQATPYEV